jgi:hypothetical protein
VHESGCPDVSLESGRIAAGSAHDAVIQAAARVTHVTNVIRRSTTNAPNVRHHSTFASAALDSASSDDHCRRHRRRARGARRFL